MDKIFDKIVINLSNPDLKKKINSHIINPLMDKINKYLIVIISLYILIIILQLIILSIIIIKNK